MKQVVDHLGSRAIRFYLKVKCSIHVHSHRLDMLAMFTQLNEKGADSFATAAFTHPQHLMCIRIGNHSGIAVSLEQGKLIHDQTPHSAPIRLSHRALTAVCPTA